MNKEIEPPLSGIEAFRAKHFLILGGIIGPLIVLSFYNFLLFHTLAELLGVGVGLGIFFIAWNARGIIDKHYFLFVGICHFFIALVSVFHTLSYKGMNIFAEHGANLPTQLWILGGYFQCFTFLSAPFFLKKKLSAGIIFSAGILVTILSFALVFSDVFPNCFLEETGLTPFKKFSEMAIAAGFIIAIVPVKKQKDILDKQQVGLLVPALIFNCLSRVAFIFYVDVYGLSNLIGHCLYLVYVYYIYLLIIEESLTRPQLSLFRTLSRQNDELEQAGKNLEVQVAQRTEELQKANAELTLSNKNLEDFAYIISHDLREPLRGINNFADILLDENAEKFNKEGRYMLRTIVKLARRQEEMIMSILEYSRIRRTKINTTEIDLHMLIQEIRENLQEKFEDPNIELILPVKLPLFFFDKSLLFIIFSNLISNAIKFNDKQRKLVEIGVIRSENSFFQTLYVKDNGIGIPEKHFDRIFVFFKRLHAKDAYGGGTGIGLAIVKNIIDMNNGKIRVESSPGNGTTFYVSLPLPISFPGEKSDDPARVEGLQES